MLWHLKRTGGRPPSGLGDHVERRLRFALSRFSGRIRRIDVFLSDQNGPRGGVDKTCRIVVRLGDGGDVVAEVSDVDWVIAVDRATTRIGQSTGREVARRRDARREGRSRVAADSGRSGGSAW